VNVSIVIDNTEVTDEKHGICAALDPKFGLDELYFNQGIQ
jgi:hypothetical protein